MKTQILIAAAVASTAGAFSVSVSYMILVMICACSHIDGSSIIEVLSCATPQAYDSCMKARGMFTHCTTMLIGVAVQIL